MYHNNYWPLPRTNNSPTLTCNLNHCRRTLGVKDACASINILPYWPMTVFFPMFKFCCSHTLFAQRVWPPFLPLFECLTIVRHNSIILRFIYERIRQRFVYFLLKLHLFCYSTAIKSKLVPFVLTWDHNITRWRMCCFLLVTRHSKATANSTQHRHWEVSVNWSQYSVLFLSLLWVSHSIQQRLFNSIMNCSPGFSLEPWTIVVDWRFRSLWSNFVWQSSTDILLNSDLAHRLIIALGTIVNIGYYKNWAINCAHLSSDWDCWFLSYSCCIYLPSLWFFRS